MKNKIQEIPAQIAVVALFALILLLPFSARSEIRKDSFEVNAFAGFNSFEGRQNLKDCPIYGGRFGFNFTRHFGIEGALEFLNSRVGDKSITGAAKGQYRSPMDKIDLTSYQLNVLFHFMPKCRLNPFIVAGYGATHYSPKISDKDMGTFNFGVGAKYWLSKHVALRVDLKDNAVGEVFKNSYQDLNATAGVVLGFGGVDKKKPAKIVKEQPKPVKKVVIIVSDAPMPKIVEKVQAIAAAPKVEEKVVILAFEDVHFYLDKSTITDNAKLILKKSILLLKDNPNAKIRIAGYTSASGTEEYNQGLSERRAKAVRDYLIEEKVVSPDRLTTIGYGEDRPAVVESAPSDLYSKAAKANMRVLFQVLVK
jgi:OOP family OmpA-OmpF porin